MAAFLRPAVIPAVLLWAVVIFSSFYNLANCPTLWWDEAIFSETAANLVQKGRYAFTMQSPNIVNDFDYRISAGPVLILPVALAYRLLGVSVWSGRLVGAAFLVLALAMMYLCARRLLSRRVAYLAVWLGLFTTDILYWGRSVLGDVPALACFFAGLYGVLRSFQTQRAWPLFPAGVCLGLAVGAKEFYGFTLVLVLAFLIWEQRRNLPALARHSGLFILGAALPLGVYLAGKAAVLGGVLPALQHFYFQKKLLCHEFFTPLTIGRLYPESGAFLLTHPLLVTGLLGFWLSGRRQGVSLPWAYWLANLTAWSLFYVTAVYWHRFALPALLLASPGAAYLLVACFDTLWQVARLPHARRWLTATGTIVCVAALFPLTGAYNLQTVVSHRNDSPYKLVAYLRQHVPQNLLIETPEYELVFLDDEHPFHLMPEFYFVESTASSIVLFNPSQCVYDFAKIRADLLILGSFGKSVFRENYPLSRVIKDYKKVATIDYYDIYLRRDCTPGHQVKASPTSPPSPVSPLQ